MSRFTSPVFQALSRIGTPLPGAKLFVFDTGTTNLTPLFSDDAQTVPRSNPVVANGAGIFPLFFFSGTTKQRLESSRGILQWERDPVKELAEVVELQNLIVILQSFIKTFDSVVDMKADTDLVAGQFVQTKSYNNNSANDVEGAANYRIMTAGEFGGSPDEFSDHTLNNGLVAKLVDQSGEVHVGLFGAVGNGTTENTTFFNAMASKLGYILIPKGNFRLATTTIDVPIYYNYGASTTVNSGDTLTITNRIESIRQFIFRGDGDYSITNDSNSGEDGRMTHAAWFDIFPTANDETVDQAPKITKAFASFGNLRESIIDFDVGRYTLKSKVDVTRGGWVRGSGTRNTVFVCVGDGYDAFETIGDAPKFTDIQFEVPLPVVERANAFIRISNNECEITNVNMGQSDKGVVVSGNNVRIKNMLAVYGTKRPANSSLVLIEGGTGHQVNGLLLGTSVGNGPEQLVQIGGPTQSGSISNVNVSNLVYVTSSRGVSVDAQAGSISNIDIAGIQSNITSGTPEDEVVNIFTDNANVAAAINITDVISSSLTPNGVQIQCDSGSIIDINMDDAVLRGSTGVGVNIVRNGGTISRVTVGDNFNAKSKSQVVAQSGMSISDVEVSPLALPNVLASYCYDFTIADDDFAQIDLDRSVFTGSVNITVATTEQGIFAIRAAPTPAVLDMNTKSANLETALVPLNGTTGTNGKFTFGVTDSVLYLENRLGSSQRVNLILMTGV